MIVDQVDIRRHPKRRWVSRSMRRVPAWKWGWRGQRSYAIDRVLCDVLLALESGYSRKAAVDWAIAKVLREIREDDLRRQECVRKLLAREDDEAVPEWTHEDYEFAELIESQRF